MNTISLSLCEPLRRKLFYLIITMRTLKGEIVLAGFPSYENNWLDIYCSRFNPLLLHLVTLYTANTIIKENVS